jgi:hypothetical protein
MYEFVRVIFAWSFSEEPPVSNLGYPVLGVVSRDNSG